MSRQIDLESKYYVVVSGHKIGICKGWSVCMPLIVDCEDAEFEDFEFEDLAYKYACKMSKKTGLDLVKRIDPVKKAPKSDVAKDVNPNPLVFFTRRAAFAKTIVSDYDDEHLSLHKMAVKPALTLADDKFEYITYVAPASVGDTFHYYMHRLAFGTCRLSMGVGVAPDYESAALEAMNCIFEELVKLHIFDKCRTLRIVGIFDVAVHKMLDADDAGSSIASRCKKSLAFLLDAGWTVKYTGVEDVWSDVDEIEMAHANKMVRPMDFENVD